MIAGRVVNALLNGEQTFARACGHDKPHMFSKDGIGSRHELFPAHAAQNDEHALGKAEITNGLPVKGRTALYFKLPSQQFAVLEVPTLD